MLIETLKVYMTHGSTFIFIGAAEGNIEFVTNYLLSPTKCIFILTEKMYFNGNNEDTLDIKL